MRIFIRQICMVLFFIIIQVSVIHANPIKIKFEQAMTAYVAKNYNRAIKLYDETLEIAPKFAMAYYYLGMCHKEIGSKISDVIWLFEKAVEYDSSLVQAYDILSRLYYESGQFEFAEKHGLRAIELNPDLMTAKLSLAWIYLMGKSEPSNAIPYFQDVLAKQNIAYAHLGLGMAYLMDDQRIKAIDMVTSLRQSGHENFAVQLENLVKQGANFNIKAPKSQKVHEPVPSASKASKLDRINPIETDSVKSMSVRLSAPMGNSDQNKSRQTSNDQSLTPSERIKALQRRSLQLPE